MAAGSSHRAEAGHAVCSVGRATAAVKTLHMVTDVCTAVFYKAWTERQIKSEGGEVDVEMKKDCDH